ncbi:flagellar hook assembly protein FlgD [Kozakia baliensis]|uniref:Basal-body rod modification protein FlgD n=1 Tax=Kozakia baliensis TaxID=153496 RepID=A0A1D8USW4_9PROT|nr:flagellar hook capping FlgD N-terminal domain-containing protein [Kozakia baliensis]AOX16723.1 hypothetical protein A0U89_05815 [Kozakia baliensis]GEL64799.1 flagellar hook assembly protein [Kozakia baliensis]
MSSLSISNNSLFSAVRSSASEAIGSSSSSTSASSSSSGALASLSNNYNTFLSLLTTQLQHQDPSNPMNTDSFTTELAQFSGVEQQVSTNKNLMTLINTVQEQEMTSGTALIGKTVSAATSQLPLQGGKADVSFNADQAGTVGIVVTDSTGNAVKSSVIDAQKGDNNWSWDGSMDSGGTAQDGLYNIGIVEQDASGNKKLSPVLHGVVSGIGNTLNGLAVKIGEASIGIGDIQTI